MSTRQSSNFEPQLAHVGWLLILILTLETGSPEITFFAGVVCVVVLAFRFGIAIRALAFLTPIYLIFLISCIVEIFQHGTDFYGLAKAAAYLARFPIFFLLGFMMASRYSDAIFVRALIISGVMLSFLYMFKYFSDPTIASATRQYIRSEIGTGYFSTWILTSIIIFKVLLSKRITMTSLLLIGVAAVAIYLSTSRSGVIFAMISIFVYAGTRVQGLWRYLPLFAVSVSLYWLAVYTPLIDLTFGISPALLQISIFSELVDPERVNVVAISEQWRGFETWDTFRYVFSRDNAILGMGLSSESLLSVPQVLAGDRVTQIGMFHNAYSLLLIRSGLTGIIIFLWFIWIMAATFTRFPSPHKLIMLLCSTILLLNIFNIPTTTGIFNQGGVGSISAIMLGIAVQRSRRPFESLGLHSLGLPRG